MAEAQRKELTDEVWDFSQIITEDDEPVDNMFSEKQQRLLTESLNSSWKPGRPFLAGADIGIFYKPGNPPVVPDTFVSLDVQAPDDMWEKRNRSYFVSEFGKPPEIAVEIVSNTKGGERGRKLSDYARAGVRYYIVFDPRCLIQKDMLRVFELHGSRYIPKVDRHLARAGIGVTLWEGVFEGKRKSWLRWTDREGNIIPTGRESAEAERERAEAERERAETERERSRVAEERARVAEERAKSEHEYAKAADERVRAERERAERLAAKLRELGISPE